MALSESKTSDKKVPNLRGIAWWGAWVGLIGGLLGAASVGITLLKEIFPPSVEVVEILPIAVVSEEPFLGSKVKVEGISVIAHLRSGSRGVSITALDANGKVYLNGNEYIVFLGSKGEGRHINEIAQEQSRRKPYFHISWSAWPTDSKVAVRLEPYEDRYIRFTFLEPTTLTGQTFLGSMGAYVGFDDDKGTRPKQITARPYIEHFFKQKIVEQGKRVMSFDVRDEIRDGLIELQIRVGSHIVKTSSDKIRRFRSISKTDWETKNPQELFLDYMY